MKKNNYFLKLLSVTIALSLSVNSIFYANDISNINFTNSNITSGSSLTTIKATSGTAILPDNKINVDSQINNAIEYYNNKYYNILTNYEITLAFLSANNTLDGYTLPDTNNFNSTYISSIASQIILLETLNKDPFNTSNNKNLVEQLLNNYDGNGKFGYFDYGLYDQAMSMIALNTIGYDYDKETVLNTLVNYYEGSEYGKNPYSFSDPDSAGKILIALAPLKDDYEKADYLIEGAINYLKSVQLEDGSFSGYSNACSTATVVSGLISVNEDVTSKSYTKNGNNPINALLNFQNSDGGFASNLGENNDDAFTFQQVLMALADYKNSISIYNNITPKTYIVTKYDLLSTINIANSIDKNSYTESSYTALYNQLTISNKAYNTENISSEEIYNQTALLRESLKNLEKQNSGGNHNNTLSVSQKIQTSTGITILSNKNYTLSKGTSVFDLLKMSLNDSNISLDYTNSNGIYISAIGNYREFEQGVNSGFEFYVNGIKPPVSCDNYILNDGDFVSWIYTTNYLETSSGSSNTIKTPNIVTFLDLAKYSNIKSSIDTKYIDDILNSIYSSYLLKEELSTFEKMFIKSYKNNISIIESLKNEVIETNGDYRKPTDLAKICLALKLYDQDLSDIEGINLYSKLKNYDNLGKQGVNGYIFALMVATEENDISFQNELIKNILKYQNDDGGFSLDIDSYSELDITSMALQGLSPYKNTENVKISIEKALSFLSANINSDLNSENISQLIMALSLLEIDINDENFIYDEKNLLDRLYTFKLYDNTFIHDSDTNISDSISTEQASLALSLLKTAYLNISNEETINNVADTTILSRLDFILLMNDIFEEEVESVSDNVFDDLTDNAQSTVIVNNFYNKGVIKGIKTKDTLTFNPDAIITKEDAVVYLSRYLNTKSKFPFKIINDFDQISDYAKDSVKSFISNDDTLLDENNNFNPKSTIQKDNAIKYLESIANR